MAPPELRFLSLPRDDPDITQHHNYVYKKSVRRSYIYHVEFGVDPYHLDFARRPIEWLYPQRTRDFHADNRSETLKSRAKGGHST